MRIVVTSRTGSPDARLRQQVEASDQALRQSFSGFDVELIEPEIVRSFEQIGLPSDPVVVSAYAQAISDRTDFEITLD